MDSLNFNVAKGCMSMIANQGKAGYLDNIGLSIEDFRRITSPVPWLGTDRNRVFAGFMTLLTSTLDVLGLPRFTLPAEFIAAGISVFIDPVNIHSACRFFERTNTAEQLGRGIEEPSNCTASQLFSLCVQLISDPDNSSARHLFEKNTGVIIRKTMIAESNLTEVPTKGVKNGTFATKERF